MYRPTPKILALMTAALCTALALRATAAVPTTSTIEGALTSVGGGAAADGTYSMTFSLYPSATAKAVLWSEKGIKIAVKGGRFAYALGSTKPLSAKLLRATSQAWLSVKIGADPELPRQRLRATPYALVAQEAIGLACSGCVSGSDVANSSISPAKVGFNYAGSITKGGAAKDLACTACVSVKELKFDGNVSLGAFSLKAKNGTFTGGVSAGTVTATAFIGDGSKLTGLKMPKGVCTKVGEVVKGINPDGTLKCVKAVAPSALPPDGLNEISNNLISNQFIDTMTTKQLNVPIPDNQGKEAISNITFPDIGTAQAFSVYVHVENTDLSKISMVVLPPNDKKKGWTLCDPCGKKDTKIYKKTFTPAAKPKTGNIGYWIGKNPKGLWNLKIIDSGFCIKQAPGNNKYCNFDAKTDGWIMTWNIKIQTLSNKKIAVNSDQYNSGSLDVAKNLTVGGNATVTGNLHVNGLVTTSAGGLNGNFQYVGISQDWRNNSGSGWRNIPQRALTFTKRRPKSIIRVTYQDTLGTLGTGYDQCRWRILVDGKQVLYFSDADITYSYNWRMSNATHTALAPGFKPGKHTIQVQSLRSGATECLMGWNTTGSFLAAEEVGL